MHAKRASHGGYGTIADEATSLNSRDMAIVFDVYDKTQIQAFDLTQP